MLGGTGEAQLHVWELKHSPCGRCTWAYTYKAFQGLGMFQTGCSKFAQLEVEIQGQPWRCSESCPPSPHAAWGLAPLPASLQLPCKDSPSAPYCTKQSPKFGGIEKSCIWQCWQCQESQLQLTKNARCKAWKVLLILVKTKVHHRAFDNFTLQCQQHSLSSRSQAMSNYPSSPCSNDPNLHFPWTQRHWPSTLHGAFVQDLPWRYL